MSKNCLRYYKKASRWVHVPEEQRDSGNWNAYTSASIGETFEMQWTTTLETYKLPMKDDIRKIVIF